MNSTIIYDLVKNSRDTLDYISNGFSGPAPAYIKFLVLKKYSNNIGDWIETGTYEGSMTNRLRKITNKIVISFEPSEFYYKKSLKRLKIFNNVKVMNSTSEDALAKVVNEVGRVVNFWLDGHFSDKKTFGKKSFCPLREELDIISKIYIHEKEVTIFIDDIRLCSNLQSRDMAYPSIKYLISWADKYGFEYIVESDILILKKISK